MPRRGNHRVVRCSCDCGGEATVLLNNLKRGMTQSCGCFRREKMRADRLTHGESAKARNTPEYRVWAHVVGRCENETDKAFKNYGARGIRVCDRWRNSFEKFVADMGRRPSAQHSIERIDVNGNYEPGNCKWATRREQSRNRRNNRIIDVGGRRLRLSDAAAIVGVKPSTLAFRLKSGWSLNRALSEPVRGSR